MAVKWAVESLQFYLTNNPFMLITDHAPFQWLHKVKDSNPRVLRWYLALQFFSFQIQHRKGTAHGHANYLSRLPGGDLEVPGGGVDEAGETVPPHPTDGLDLWLDAAWPKELPDRRAGRGVTSSPAAAFPRFRENNAPSGLLCSQELPERGK